MKRKILVAIIAVSAAAGITACSEASRVESNLTKEADNFNVVRQLTVINCLQGDVLFQMSGKNQYTLNFNPNMWLPVEVDTID